MRAKITIVTALTLAALAAPAFSQGMPGGPPPPAPPPGHAFKAPPGDPMATQNGRAIWRVYRDCDLAYMEALKASTRAEKDAAAEQARLAAVAEANTAAADDGLYSEDYYTWQQSLAEMSATADTVKRLQDQQLFVERRSVLMERAIDAYAAQTGKPRPEAEAFVRASDVEYTLTVERCEGLR
jgi:hypothetical protein